MLIKFSLKSLFCFKGTNGPQPLERRRQVGEDRTPSGGFQALDISRGLQEIPAQDYENDQEGNERDYNPGDYRHSHGYHTHNLQEGLDEVSKRQGKQVVQLADVFGETVQDSPNGIYIEEPNWSSQYGLKHLVVQSLC